MSKHTPGPWEWDGPVWQYDKDNEAPWLVQHPWRSVESKTVLSGSIKCQSEADARLISAAPDLVELAEGFQAVCARIIEQYGPVTCGIDFATLGGAVNRVLAKVEGEA